MSQRIDGHAHLGDEHPAANCEASADVYGEIDANLSRPDRAKSFVIASTFTADLIEKPLKFWLERLEVAAEIMLAPYAQVMQELLGSNSSMSLNKRGFNILLVKLDDWIRDRLDVSLEENVAHIRKATDELIDAIDGIVAGSGSNVFVVWCPPSGGTPKSYREPLEEIQAAGAYRLRSIDRVRCWLHADIEALYPVDVIQDPRMDRIAHIPYSSEYFAAIATFIARNVASQLKSAYKVIALDCDNTLWKGICGEDGSQGVMLTPAYEKFQETLVRLHDAGMLLCLCSKNNSADVDAVFKANPEWPLREEHLICSRVNWNPKSANLQSIAEELSLSLDSFILIDDSPVECAEVRAHCPSILTLEIPNTEAEISHFTDHVWAFDQRMVTAEASRRSQSYKQNKARRRAMENAHSIDEFLRSLELKVEVSSMQPEQAHRVVELIQRTNQFNLTTIRRSLNELNDLAISGHNDVLVIRVRDRFGDYGLVGAVLYEKRTSSLVVDTFVLSCRVLGRGVEYRILNALGDVARQRGLAHVILRYRATPKNAPARMFLEGALRQFRDCASEPVETEVTYTLPTEAAERFRENPHEFAASTLSADAASAGQDLQRFAPHNGGWVEHGLRLSRVTDFVREMEVCTSRRIGGRIEYAAPRTPEEAAIAAIWSDILVINHIGIRDNFIELGGDSVSAVRAVARIEALLGVELSLHEFFETPTIEAVAKIVSNAPQSDSLVPLREPVRVAPLSWGQQRLWFIDQLEGTAAYHIPIVLRLRGALDRVAITNALNALVDRHESLRTTFKKKDSDLVQHISLQGQFNLEVIDLAECVDEKCEVEVRRQRLVEANSTFDLCEGPLFRGTLIRCSSEDHVLLMTLHHIIADGWSVGIVLRELGALYDCFHNGEPNTLPELPLQYSDYVQWQRRFLGEKKLEQRIAYWKHHLDGAPELIELPTDRPRRPVQGHAGSSIRVTLDSVLAAELKALAQRFDLTLSMVLHAAWALLIYRLSGCGDVVIGIPVANRRRTEFEGIIGFFVNTLAVRVTMSSRMVLADLLLHVRDKLLGAYAHQDAPFEKVVEAVNPTRSLSHSPIFQVMFAFQNAPRTTTKLGGLIVTEDKDHSPHTAQFDLALELYQYDSMIVGSISYRSDLYDQVTIERWGNHFETMVCSMVRCPEEQLGRLKLMNDEQLRSIKILSGASGSADSASEGYIHAEFEAQVVRNPSAVAVVCGERSLTYSELDGRANQVARYLIDQGTHPGELVGIYVERSLEMIVGLLGVLKAGAAYVPLDPSYPPDRLAYMLEDCAPKVVLTQSALLDTCPIRAGHVVSLDSDWALIAERSRDGSGLVADEQASCSLAYVIYTSGSTGRPKGVMVEHRNVITLWHGLKLVYERSKAPAHVGLNASLSFDASVQQWVQLLSGATLHVIPDEIRRDAARLLQFIRLRKISGIDCTPSQLRSWVTVGLLRKGGPLRLVLVGGEAIDADLWGRMALSSEIHFFNVYGPTECTVDATVAQINAEKGTPHIGRPMADRRVYILDEELRPVPIGVTGEIYIAGAGVGRGYYKRPQLTAERFLADPFGDGAACRMYKTGDLGRRLSNGNIEYLGRNDTQVKIRGFRIELGEIEAQLSRHDGVKQAAVVVREDALKHKQLVAYVVLRNLIDAQSPSIGFELREHLKRTLPSFMLPGAVVVMDRLPLTQSGKLDAHALPSPEVNSAASHRYEVPKGETERILAEIWEALLQSKRIGRHDNFFELGGHSLLVLEAVSRINQSLGATLAVTDVYRHPTVSELAERVSGNAARDSQVNLTREAVLDEDFIPRAGPLRRPERSILLTGATGFVGRFLLTHLLQQTRATIYCLVRAPSREEAKLRLKVVLAKWDLWQDEFNSRLVAIPGDLRLARLGIEEVTYNHLCDCLDSVYDCATSMNHLEPFAMAKQTNVVSARELLRIATRGRPKLLNYISTLSVFGSSPSQRLRVVDERSTIDHEEHLESQGYVASKWVSEKIMMLASARGIPCNIFRLGLVWADAQQGRYDELQNVYRVMKSCLLSGYGIADYRYLMPPTPVDAVARAIVHLSNTHPDGGGIFHISSNEPGIKGIFEHCRDALGVPLRLLPLFDWICQMRQLHRDGRSPPVAPLIEYAFSMDRQTFEAHQKSTGSERTSFDCSQTQGELGRAGIVLAVLDHYLLKVCVEGMLSRDTQLREALNSHGTFGALWGAASAMSSELRVDQTCRA